MRIVLALAPVTGTWFAFSVAQASGANLDAGLLSLIGNGVTVVVLAWYVIYDVRIRTPSMLAAFQKEQEEIRKAFKDEQTDSRETWTTTIEGIRSTFVTEQVLLRSEHKEDRAVLHAKHAEEILGWRIMVNDLMKAFRDAVHDVGGMAQQTVTKADEVIQLSKGGQNK